MSDFSNYLLASSEKRAAYSEYNSASRGLELAQIKERLAECKSQHQPLETLMLSINHIRNNGGDNVRESIREELVKLLDYVVLGKK